ncbi:MAG: hypothetical protein GX447_02475 [Elusimicrobia bacterium]|nr:hypothetical protein [Elusimicrobiota bacterium]
MKKNLIIAAVVLMGIALIYKYSSKPKTISAPGIPLPVQNEDVGASLPADAKKVISESETDIVGSCSKNIASILEDFGKIWDVAPAKDKKVPLINQEDSLKISEMLASYESCSALSLGDRDKCESLPSKYGVGGRLLFPRELCKYKYDNIALAAYSAGKYEKKEVCSDFLYSHNIEGVSVEDFCQALKKGFPSVCEEMKGKVDKDILKGCYFIFPKNISSCGKEADCADSYSAYEAFSSGKSEKCLSKESCSALTNKSESFCSPLKEKLLNFYCEAYSKGLKKAEEDAKKMEEMEKAKIADIEKQKAYEERKRKDAEKAEQEKIKEKLKRAQEDADKEIKKLLEKRPGSGE